MAKRPKLAPLKGDSFIWALSVLLLMLSFLPVYSTSSFFAHMYNSSTTIIILKHVVHTCIGFGVIFMVHRIPFERIRRYSPLLLLGASGLLFFTVIQGNTIQGANASRWANFRGISFQPSTMAAIALIIYLANILGKSVDSGIKIDHKHPVFIKLMGSILIVCALIFPSNFSSSAMLGLVGILILAIGQFPIRLLATVSSVAVLVATLFILIAISFPRAFPSRVNTWMSRVESFVGSEEGEAYQPLKSKNAIINGGIFGQGPGKSVYKNELPQSSSDFIYAIIVEEYGMMSGLVIIFFYTILFMRMIAISNRLKSVSQKLAVYGFALWITIQAYVNMGVAVGIFPVTGQTLPFISTGGSSILMTGIAIGVVLSITREIQTK